jgi:hypothetical protein
MSLTEFIQTVKSDGLARSNRYMVVFNKPKSVYMGNENNIRTYCLFCDQTELPGLSYATTGIRTFGEVRETPYDKNSESINLSFYVDANLDVKHFFDKWVNSIMDVESRTWNYYDEYISPSMSITVLNKNEKSVYNVNLYECYPKSIAPITVSYGNNEVMKMTVNMQYKYWKSEQLGYVGSADLDIANALSSNELLNLPPTNTGGFVIPPNYFSNNQNFQQSFLDTYGNVKQEVKPIIPFTNFG